MNLVSYVLTITVFIGPQHVSRELPNRFATLEQCQSFFAQYAKELRHPPDARVSFVCERN
jgi:hypothetical protein